MKLCSVCTISYVEGNTEMCASCNNLHRRAERAKLKMKSKPQYFLNKATKPINKTSEKRKEVLKDYSPIRTKYLKDHPKCMASLELCTLKSTEIHHASTSNLDHNNIMTWLAVCRNCHHAIETVMSSKDRRLMGFLI